MTNYTETNYDDSRRMTNYTDYTEDSRRNTAYTDYTEDSRRNTAYTDYTEDDSRRNTAYTDYTEDSRRNTAYTDYTEDDSRRNTAYTDYTEDSRRNTAYTDYTEGSSYTNRDSRYSEYTNRDSRYSEYTNRDSRYSEYTEGSSYTSCSCSDPDCSHRKSYSEYSSYTDSRRQTYSSYTDSRRQTYTTDYSSYSSDFCETQDASDLPSKILPNTSIEPFGTSISNESLIAIQSKQNVMRDSICSLLPDGPMEGKPPKIDLEFIAQKDYQASKSGELNVKTMDVLRVIENLEGGCYMVSNSTTGMTGKIPAYVITTLL
jgi:hypothetical protein